VVNALTRSSPRFNSARNWRKDRVSKFCPKVFGLPTCILGIPQFITGEPTEHLRKSELEVCDNIRSDESWVCRYVRETKRRSFAVGGIQNRLKKNAAKSTGPIESTDAVRYRLSMSMFGVLVAEATV
jgi:hypothetical protein